LRIGVRPTQNQYLIKPSCLLVVCSAMSCGENIYRVSTTPILDSGVLPVPVRHANGWTILAAATIGFLSVFVLMIIGVQAKPNVSLFLSYLLTIAAVFLAITVHELGHLFAGWAVGFRFSFISVGPFSLHLEHGALRVRFGSKGPALGYAGMQVDRVRRLRRRLLIFGIAGPAANLFSVPTTALLLNYGFPKLSSTWVASFAAQFLVVSLIFALLNGHPMGASSISDASRIKTLLRSPSQARRLMSVAGVGSQHSRGIRPKNWKRTWLKSATLPRDGSSDELYGNWLAYIAANDRKDPASAEARLERCLELSHKVWPSLRDQIAHECSVYCAWFRNDDTLAEKWLVQVKKASHLTPLQKIRADVAMNCARGDFPAALDSWQDGLALIAKASGPQGRQLTESWQDWKIEIQERRSQIVIA
jgi:hypothetical protein